MFFWFLEIAWPRALLRLDLHSTRDVGGAT
jgi:hypothetical protein